MGTLWLYAISLDDVRDFFAAPDELAASLLASANEVTREPTKPPLINKVGPLLRHPVAPAFEAPAPCMDDARAMVEGRALPPDRLGLAWVIVRHWCAQYCCDSAQITVDRERLATLDFAHVASGLSSQFSFGTVLSRDPHLPLLSAPGLVIGWMPNRHLRLMATQWAQATTASGASPSNPEQFTREDTTGVGLTWPLSEGEAPAYWGHEWDVLNGFFVRAADFAVTPSGPHMVPPDVLAMFQ